MNFNIESGNRNNQTSNDNYQLNNKLVESLSNEQSDQEIHHLAQNVLLIEPSSQVLSEKNVYILSDFSSEVEQEEEEDFDNVQQEPVQEGNRQGWIKWATNGLTQTCKSVGITAAKKAVSLGMNVYSYRLDKTQLVRLKSEMQEIAQDPQYIQLFYFINQLLIQKVRSSSIDLITQHDELITQLLEINLARGFINLAKQVKQEENLLFNTNDQPLLARCIILFCQRAGTHIDLNKMTDPQALSQMFDLFVDDILHCLYPKGIADMEVPGFIKISGIAERLYSFIKSPLKNFLQSSYQSIAPNEIHQKQWTDDLKACVGNYELDSVAQAPVIFISEFIKNFIQTEPRLVDWISELLGNSISTNRQTDSLFQLKQQLLRKPLAHSIVYSLQILLQSKDPAIQGLGQFFGRVLSNFSLAILSKTISQIADTDQEKIPEDMLLFTLKDYWKQTLENHSGSVEEIKDFWLDFVKDLPLPSYILNMMVPKLIDQAKNTWDIKESIEQLDNKLIQHMNEFQQGKQLLSITEKISDQIVEYIVEENLDLIQTFNLSETLQELTEQYFPGVSIDPQLKNWFTNNIKNLGFQNEEISSQSTKLLRQIIRVVLRKTLIDTYQETFNGSEEVYVAQLLDRILDAFKNSFNITVNTRNQPQQSIRQALSIQNRISHHQEKLSQENKKLKQIKQKYDGYISELTEEKKEILNHVSMFTKRLSKTSNNIYSLGRSQDQILHQLNQKLSPFVLNLDHLDRILALLPYQLKQQEENLESIELLQESLNAITSSYSDFEVIQILKALEIEDLKLISQLLNLNYTIQHAENSFFYLKKEYDLILVQNSLAEQDLAFIKELDEQQNKIFELEQEIKELKHQLDPYLGQFRQLANELCNLLGFTESKKIEIHPKLDDKIWSMTESVRDHHVTRLLFEQMAPALDVYFNHSLTQEQLENSQIKNVPFLNSLCENIANHALATVPTFISSYQTVVTQLDEMGDHQLNAEGIHHVERDLQNYLLTLGKQKINLEDLRSLLKLFFAINVEEVNHHKKNLFKYTEEDIEGFCQDLKSEFEQEVQFKRHELSASETLQQKISLFMEDHLVDKRKNASEMLLQRSRGIAREINQYLHNVGKKHLTAENLAEIYFKNGGVINNEPEFIQAIQDQKLTSQIRNIFITPEGIAHMIHDAIPGAQDMQVLITSQLQAILTGQANSLIESRQILRRFIEELILNYMAKIAKVHAQPGQDLFTLLINKFEDIVKSSAYSGKFKDQPSHDIAVHLVNQVVEEIFTLKSASDLIGLPLTLQKPIYTQIKKQLLQQVVPFILPLVERHQQSLLLEQRSGSNFLGDLSQQLAKDVFMALPSFINDYKQVAQYLCKILSKDGKPAIKLVNVYAQRINQFICDSSNKKITNEILVNLYAEVSHQLIDQTVSTEEESYEQLLRKMELVQAEKRVKKIIISPQEMVAQIKKHMPAMSIAFEEQLTEYLTSFINSSSLPKQKFTYFVQQWLEGILLQIFNRLVEKYPSENGQDSIVILVDILLKEIEGCYQQVEIDPTYSLTTGLQITIQKVLGLDSKDFFAGLPPFVQEGLIKQLNYQIKKITDRVQYSLAQLGDQNDQVQKAKEELKTTFGSSSKTDQGYVECITDQFAQLIVNAVPSTLVKKKENQMQAVRAMGTAAESFLEQLIQQNFKVGQMLLNYSQKNELKSVVANNLEQFANSPLKNTKEQAAKLVSHLIIVPFNRVAQQILKFEEKNKAVFLKDLLTEIFKESTSHVKIYNQTKQQAIANNKKITHQALIEEAENQKHPLHPAVPVAANYQEVLAVIESYLTKELTLHQQNQLKQKFDELVSRERKGIEKIQVLAVIRVIQEETGQTFSQDLCKTLSLVEMIRQEGKAPQIKTGKEFLHPVSKQLLKLVFPKGKEELTFISEDIRPVVWKQFKQQLLPTALSFVTETLLDPRTITGMILNGLKSVHQSLDQPIKPSTLTKKIDCSITPLEESIGDLCEEMIQMLEIPSLIKKQLIDPKTGKLSNKIKLMMGHTLQKQFTDTFIKDHLQEVIKKLADKSQDMPKNLENSEKEKLEKFTELAQMHQEMKQEVRYIVNTGIFRGIYQQWVNVQAKFDHLVEKTLGKTGTQIKKELDKTFNFMFFKVVGTVLSTLLSPVKKVIQKALYRYLALDNNLKIVTDFLTQRPEDQFNSAHVVYHENWLYNLANVVQKTVKEV